MGHGNSAYPNCLVILYDTSFLMSDRAPRNVPDFIELKGDSTIVGLELGHLIPLQVTMEIANNLRFPDKRAAAARARGAYSVICDAERFGEPDVRTITVKESEESLLGPDSLTDKRLIAFAESIAWYPQTAVVVATNDGGISLEIKTRAELQGTTYRVYSSMNIHQIMEFLKSAAIYAHAANIEEVLLQHRKIDYPETEQYFYWRINQLLDGNFS